MNKKKTALIGLATATCLAFGGFALTACNEQTDTRDTVLVNIYYSEKESGKTDKEYDAWLLEKLTALNGKDGKDGADGTDGTDGKNGVSITYIGKLGDDYVAYYSDGTTQVIPVIDTTLDLGDNSIKLNDVFAKYGVEYKFTSTNGGVYTATATGTDVYVYGDDEYEPYLSINQYENINSYSFSLEAGESITFTCTTNSFEAGEYTLNIVENATLSFGANEIILTDSQALDGIVYAYVAADDGIYKFSVSDDSDVYVYGSNKYSALLSVEPDTNFPDDNITEYSVSIKKGDYVVLHCGSFTGDAASYTLTVAKTEPDKINVGDEAREVVLSGSYTYTANLVVDTAGTYTLDLNPYANGSGNTYTVTVNGQDYSVSYVADLGFKLDLDLAAGTTSISIKSSSSLDATLRITLSAKA
jgi:hypothetical protein